ncbi:unnamed protein product [Urochloa decumbens]|uniref:KIB1-4 beta-propeller domain-containing protein n=1 Tax=Urochloa decumbens TaxID=240449 RepID=A0ABC8XQB6_9POAL
MVDVPAPPLRPWADLDTDLVSCIGDCCAPRDYASCRAVCVAWRSALPPLLSLPLAVLPADAAAGHPAVSVAACFLRARRWSRLPGLRCPTALVGDAAASCRCVGARDGWIALVAAAAADGGALLFNPFTGAQIKLQASLYDPTREEAPKVVFSPDPTPHDFAAVSVTRPNRIAVQRAADGYSDSVVKYTNHLMDGADLVDVAYGGGGGDGKVYCLAKGGEVYVLRLKRRRRRGAPWLPALEVGPLHRAPLGADAFPAPYNVISQHTDAKNLLLYDGALYQVWRRPNGAGSVTVDAPAAGGKRWVRISEGEVFVLRYEPGRWPRWAVAEGKELGGNAVFVGINDAAVVRGEGVSANSVYYWDSPPEGGHEPVVFNMATRASVRWPAVATGGTSSSPVWYFLPAATDEETTSEEAACPEYDDEHSAADM